MWSMSGYTKLFSSIIGSTIWREDNDTRIVWITLLAMADKDGVVEASVPGLADFARIPVEATRAALSKLMSPDPDSRTKDWEGRRVEEVDGGWRLLNHAKYRAKLSDIERREYKRRKQEEYRRRGQPVDTSGQCDQNVDTGDTSRSKSRVQKQKTEEDVLAALWNERTTPPLLPVSRMTASRRKHTKARLGEASPEAWAVIIDRIQASDFCRGVNDRGWLATFDWLIGSPDVAVKVMEGKYDNRTPRKQPTAPMPTYTDSDWCQHEPKCSSRDWHAILVAKEGA